MVGSNNLTNFAVFYAIGNYYSNVIQLRRVGKCVNFFAMIILNIRVACQSMTFCCSWQNWVLGELIQSKQSEVISERRNQLDEG